MIIFNFELLHQITSLQTPLQFCHSKLKEDLVTRVTSHAGLTFVLGNTYRLTGFRTYYLLPQYNEIPFVFEFCVEYYDGTCIWEQYKDVNGTRKIYTVKELEHNFDFEGFAFGRFDPEIVADRISILRKVASTELFFHPKKYELFGCRDDYAISDFQYGGYKNGLMTSNPTPTETLNGCVVYDFEDGNLNNWIKVGKAFKNQPTFGDPKFLRTGMKFPTGFHGKWWISSYENNPFFGAATGVGSLTDVGSLISPAFVIDVPIVTFLIGGEYRTGQIGVEIRRYNSIVASFYLSFSTPDMKEMALNINETLLGSLFNLHLIDNSADGYLMFDYFNLVKDSCSCDCCEKLGMEKNSGSKYYIESKSITGFCNSTNNPPDNARFSQKLNYYTSFRCLRNSLSYLPWLSIKLVYLSVIDGWSSQGVFAAENCLVTGYQVMYAYKESMWRYIKSSPDNIVYYMNMLKDGSQREKLNPRIEAQHIRFIFIDAADNLNFCFRVEIYGCSKYSFNSNGQPFLKKNIYTRNAKNDKDYQLKLIDISDTQTSINLSCLNKSEIIYPIQNQYQWWEIIYNTKINLNNPLNTINLSLEKNFYKRTLQCFVTIPNAKSYTIIREFLIISEIERPSLVPFVTMDPGFEYRGGTLVSGNPSVFYTDSVQQAFVSLHIADLVHPLLIYSEYQYYCPFQHKYFHPFENLKQYYGINEDPLRCFNEAIQDGHHSFFYDGNRLLAGKQTNVMATLKNGVYECVYITEESYRQYMMLCEKNCSSYNDANYNPKYTREFFKLIKTSLWKKINLKVDVNGVLKYKTSLFVEDYQDLMGAFRTRSNFYETEFYTHVDKVASINQTIYPIVQYLDCNTGEAYSLNGFYPFKLNEACVSLFTPYGSIPQGTGHFLTFLYMFPVKSYPVYPRVKIYGEAYYANNEKSYFEQTYDVQHISKPVIILDSNIGICKGEYREIVPTIKISGVKFNGWNTLKYSWSWINEETFEAKETINLIQASFLTNQAIYIRQEKLIIIRADDWHTKTYLFEVDSILGKTSKRTKITVYSDYPKITWITPSPTIVVQDISDILEIKTNTDNFIKEINWYLNGTVIENSIMFSFLDYQNMPYQRKRLMLSNMDNSKMSGTYSVVLVSDFCSFKNTIDVIVYENPIVSINKKFVSILPKSLLELKATIIGGYPPIQPDNISWRLNGNKIVSTETSQMSWWVDKISATLVTSTLIITETNFSDGGQYIMEVVLGPSVIKVDAIVKILTPVVKNQTKVVKSRTGGKHDFVLHSLKITVLTFFSFFLY
ncbi:uncharacterized protein LOC105843411 isoform X5 [Hydra vulgaris]|uniref:Uncharacterized protein LOC105843411 isoform X5 n=1 Tax=Hydra vulgaris TaxID=6087 RepID=A0ABM4DJQ2_HYDVU